MKKRCTNSACRRFFNLSGDRTACPWCGREYRFNRAEKPGVVQDAARMHGRPPTGDGAKRYQEAAQARSWGSGAVEACRKALCRSGERQANAGQISVWHGAGVHYVLMTAREEMAQRRNAASRPVSALEVARSPMRNRYAVRLEMKEIPYPKKFALVKALRGCDRFLSLRDAAQAANALEAPVSILHVDGQTLCEMVVQGVDCIRVVRPE